MQATSLSLYQSANLFNLSIVNKKNPGLESRQTSKDRAIVSIVMLDRMRKQDARDLGCTEPAWLKAVNFCLEKNLIYFFEILDFIEPEEDQELDAAFGDAVNEVCNGKICKINCVCNRPLELHAGLIMFGNVGW